MSAGTGCGTDISAWRNAEAGSAEPEIRTGGGGFLCAFETVTGLFDGGFDRDFIELLSFYSYMTGNEICDNLFHPFDAFDSPFDMRLAVFAGHSFD